MTLCTLFFASALLAADPNLKPYPLPEEGQARYLITLPKVSHPEHYQIALEIGKTRETDCNTQMQGGKMSQKTAQGWGYDYYVLEAVSEVATTLMACPPELQKRNVFLPLRLMSDGKPFGALPYNDKLPIVVYVPKGFFVRYQIWQKADTQEGKEG